MMRNPSTSNTTFQQQTVQEAFHSENKEDEHFYQAADSTNDETKPDEIIKSVVKSQPVNPVASQRSSKKLKRSATTISPCARDSDTNVRPSSVEDKLINVTDSEKGANQLESPQIIEVKKPPTPLAAWDNVSQVVVNKPEELGKSIGDNKTELIHISGNVGDANPVLTGTNRHESPPIIEVKKPPSPLAAWDNLSQVVVNKTDEHGKSIGDIITEVVHTSGNVGDANPVRTGTLPVRNSSFSRENKIKSSIPRFTKVKPKEKIVAAGEKNEKKTFSGLTKIPTGKSNSPSRPLQTQTNQSWKSSPSRSRASTISSRPISPSAAPHSVIGRSKTPCGNAHPGYRNSKEKEKELHNMLEEMCSTLGQLKGAEDKVKTASKERPLSQTTERNKEIKKPLKIDLIMPAKSSVEETLPKVKDQDEPIKVIDIDGAAKNLSTDFDVLSRKADVLQGLSELNSQNQLNLKELHNVIAQITKSCDNTYNKQLELQFYNMEQTQIELVQKLVRTATKYFEEREQFLIDNNNFRDKQEKLIPEIEEKLGILEAENTSLLDKLRVTTRALEDERQISQKRKVCSDGLRAAKQRLQRAEAKLQQLESRTNELSGFSKRLEASVKQKETVAEHFTTKIQLLESTIAELGQENSNLKEEIEYIKNHEEEKMKNFVQDSQELKEARMQLIALQEKLTDEIDRREKSVLKLQDTTSKMKALEERTRNLAAMADSCKNEIKIKQVEFSEKEKSLTEEINQLRTEVQARKVMLKVAEDEVALTKNKLDKAETQARQEQMKEKDICSAEEQLRLDLAIRDEQITQLQEQIKGLIEKKFSPRESARTKNRLTKLSEKHSGSSFNERVALTAQVVDLERTIDTLAKDNLQLNQLLNQKNLELDQRDRIVKMQTEVLKIRDELIYLLKSKEAKHEEDIKRLNDIIKERESAIAKEWSRAIEESAWTLDPGKGWQKTNSIGSQDSSGELGMVNPGNEESMYLSGTMYDLYSSLEKKQMELEVMQQRVQQLEGMQDAYNQQRTRQEARISKLEMALSEKCLDTSGIFKGDEGIERGGGD